MDFWWISYGSLDFFLGKSWSEKSGNGMTLPRLQFGQRWSEMGYHGWQSEWNQTIHRWTTQILGTLFSDKVLKSGTKLMKFPCNSVRKPTFTGEKPVGSCKEMDRDGDNLHRGSSNGCPVPLLFECLLFVARPRFSCIITLSQERRGKLGEGERGVSWCFGIMWCTWDLTVGLHTHINHTHKT